VKFTPLVTPDDMPNLVRFVVLATCREDGAVFRQAARGFLRNQRSATVYAILAKTWMPGKKPGMRDGMTNRTQRIPPDELRMLGELERKVLWLASWTIHYANHLRESTDGLKVGGHQASSASLATIMTVLYFRTLRPQDRVAVKPHASVLPLSEFSGTTGCFESVVIAEM